VAWRQRAAFFDDLFADRLGESEAIGRRARQLGFALEAPARLLLVGLAASNEPEGHAHSGELRQELAELVERVAHQRLPQACVAARGAHVLVLLSAALGAPDQSAQLAAQIVTAGREHHAHLSLAVGLSAVASSLDGLARAYGEAEEALAVLTHLGGSTRTLAYEELGLLGMLLRGATRDELLRLAHRRLDGLAAYGQRRGVNLIATLECYLRNGCQIQRTAELLFVHANTVKHRLRLAGEQSELDLSDMGQLLELQLALLVRRIHPDAFGA
jgi:sugar diacid utilization regulator